LVTDLIVVLALVFLLDLLLFGRSHLSNHAVLSLFVHLLHIVTRGQHLMLAHCADTLPSSPLLTLPFGSFLGTTLVESSIELLKKLS
jgi:hypothetical protein